MIRQVGPPVQFADASLIRVALPAPSVQYTTLVLAVFMVGAVCVPRVSDNLAAPRWRQANCDGGVALLSGARSCRWCV